MIGFRTADRGLGIISLLILARLLMPEDFGLVAIAMSVVALIELTGAFGFDVVLIQHRDPKDEHFNTVFTLNVLIGVGGGLALAGLAHVTAVYFADDRLIHVMYVLGIAWAVQGFENVGTVMFRRNMEFRREFAFLTSKRLLTFVTTLIAAFVLRSYWALVIGIVTGRVAMVVLSYAMHSYRPRFSLAAIRELMSFSFWLFLGNVVGFFNQRLSTFIIGRFDGAHQVGQYTVAYEIGTLPTSELLAPINRAIIPGFARMACEPDHLRDGFLAVMSLTTAFAVPAAFGIAAIAEPLVITLLTDKWAEAVPLLQVLAFLGAISAITSSAFPAFYALGRPRVGTLIHGLRLATVVPAMLAGASMFGVIGIAWADLSATLLVLPFSIVIACRALDLSVTTLLRQIWRPFAASLGMYFSVKALLEFAHATYPGLHGVTVLLAAIGAGIVIYAILLFVLWFVLGRDAGIEARLLQLARHNR